MRELPKVYDPKQVEKKIYDMWLGGNYFHAERDPEKKPFTIVIPPPNVTGQLHLGHAFDETIQDVLIRYKRMDGYSTLWLPGYDHAGIATQIKVEEKLRGEGKTRFDLGRDKFLDEVWAWKNKYGDRIVEQLKTLGSSCDWERQRFTMDDTCARAVRETFVDLYQKKLIYKGKRIINWCPKCTTALSDAEVEYVDKPGHLWHVRYPLSDGSGDLIIATTRPETMLGDTGVAVNPNDERYTDIVGKTCILPLVGREIPIVADDYVEMDFGTGCVKMTPCHDPNDFEVAQRHDLDYILILDDDAKIINGGKYNGMDRYEARKAIVADLEAEGYLVKVEDYAHSVGTCYRCHSDVEPISSEQWFVKMAPLAKEAIRVVEDGEVKFVPERFSKTYLNWMYNVRDWCISRQLWWGHRIPAYYCDDCGEVIVAKEAPTTCPKCGSTHLHQDEDTLDTWFSSALWPFSTLGWPDKTPELEYFYPTNTLVTGYDIIFFWVARMIFSGLEHTGKIPFDTVLFHGLVRDAQGRKMSKSLGNGIDPLEIIDQYGADALRFTLATGNTPGNDMRFSDEKVIASRNFANKIWNASRFVLMNLKDEQMDLALPLDKLAIEDKWVLSKFNKLVREVTDNLEKFELGIAVSKLYDFIWDVFCDWYVELVKSRLWEDGAEAEVARQVLVYVLSNTLKLLHPFMPFITEEIWQALPHEGESIMVSQWPVYDEKLDFAAEEREFEKVMDAIKAVRTRRSEMNVPPSKKATLYIETASQAIFEQSTAFLTRLAWADQIVMGSPEDLKGCVQVITDSAKVYMPLSQLVDRDKEIARLTKEKQACEKDISFLEGKLNNPGFVSKAPEKVVNDQKAKLEKAKELLSKIESSLAAFNN